VVQNRQDAVAFLDLNLGTNCAGLHRLVLGGSRRSLGPPVMLYDALLALASNGKSGTALLANASHGPWARCTILERAFCHPGPAFEPQLALAGRLTKDDA
jgi:hypothetical protein